LLWNPILHLQIDMKRWEVTYKLPATGSKYHKTIVEANYQHDAKKIAQAQIPSAIICGGPQPVR